MPSNSSVDLDPCRDLPVTFTSSRMYALRWILALLVPALGLAVTILGAALLTEALEVLCPPELMVSGRCSASWYRASEQAAYALASFVGALIFVSLPAVAAPAFKPAVARVAFGAGLAFAGFFLWQVGP